MSPHCSAFLTSGSRKCAPRPPGAHGLPAVDAKPPAAERARHCCIERSHMILTVRSSVRWSASHSEGVARRASAGSKDRLPRCWPRSRPEDLRSRSHGMAQCNSAAGATFWGLPRCLRLTAYRRRPGSLGSRPGYRVSTLGDAGSDPVRAVLDRRPPTAPTTGAGAVPCRHSWSVTAPHQSAQRSCRRTAPKGSESPGSGEDLSPARWPA